MSDHPTWKERICFSHCLLVTPLNLNSLSNLFHTWEVFCLGPRDVKRCTVYGVIGTQHT